MKQQLSSLQEELKGKEGRWASAHNRLRQQVDSLRQENGSLRDEVPASPFKHSKHTSRQAADLVTPGWVFLFKVRVLEKLRLNALKNNVANAEKVQKMSPKVLENSTSATSKGVKFAVRVVLLFLNHFKVFPKCEWNLNLCITMNNPMTISFPAESS